MDATRPVCNYDPVSRSPFVKPGTYRSLAEITSLLRAEAKQFYYPLPGQAVYHVWEHVQRNEEVVLKLIERFRESGRSVDKEIVLQANILHDAFYHVPPHCLGFESKEHLAACFAYHRLIQLGATEEHARTVEFVIAATNPLIEFESMEALILRAADLAGIAVDFDIFENNTWRLFEEAKRFGFIHPYERFVRDSLRHLAVYLVKDLRVTGEGTDGHGVSTFHLNAMRNILALARKSLPQITVELQFGLDQNGSIDRLSGDGQDRTCSAVRVVVEEDSEKREACSQRLQIGDAKNHLLFVLPGSARAIPLPDRSCDALIGVPPTDSGKEADPLIRAEIDRVLRA